MLRKKCVNSHGQLNALLFSLQVSIKNEKYWNIMWCCGKIHHFSSSDWKQNNCLYDLIAALTFSARNQVDKISSCCCPGAAWQIRETRVFMGAAESRCQVFTITREPLKLRRQIRHCKKGFREIFPVRWKKLCLYLKMFKQMQFCVF